MLKSTGVKKTNIAVFISGNGTNFKNLIQYSLKKKSKFKIKLVVSNNSNAKGLEYAKKFKIKKKIINYKNLINSEINILDYLNKEKKKALKKIEEGLTPGSPEHTAVKKQIEELEKEEEQDSSIIELKCQIPPKNTN